MASRILGGGDMASLIEKAQDAFDAEEMEQQQAKMLEGKFTLEDFRNHMRQIKQLGPLKSIMSMIPGMDRLADMDPDMNPEEEMKQLEGIINSMTLEERRNPDKIDRSRRNRIARGSGTEPADVNNLLKQFKAMSGVMQQMAGLGVRDRMRAVKQMADGGLLDPGANIRREKQRSKRGPLDLTRAREDKKKKRKDARKARKRNRR
jgi:signal recognition particle subunit SRP54